METENDKTTGLWTASEVAEYLQVEESTVETWAKNRRIPVVKVGRLNRFRREDIDGWLEERAEPVRPEVA